MKKVKKLLTLLMGVFIFASILTGCKPKMEPNEVAKALIDLDYKNDQSGVSKLGMQQKDIDSSIKKSKDEFNKSIKDSFTSSGMKITDAQIEQMYNALEDSFKKATVTTEIVSKDSKTAQVKVKATYIDMNDVAKKAQDEVLAQIKTLKVANQQEALNKAGEIFINSMLTELKNVKPSTDTKEFTAKFIIKDRIWQPEGIEKFYSDFDNLLIGQ